MSLAGFMTRPSNWSTDGLPPITLQAEQRGTDGGRGGGDQDAAAAETKLQGRAEAGLSGQRGPAKMDCAKEMGRASFPGKLEPVTGATQEVNRGDLLRPGECPAYVGTNQTTGIKQGA